MWAARPRATVTLTVFRQSFRDHANAFDVNQAAAKPPNDERIPPFARELPQEECHLTRAICALLDDLGCDDDTRAAAGWYALARTRPEIWTQQAPAQSEDVRRLVEGQQQAETVWALHKDRG